MCNRHMRIHRYDKYHEVLRAELRSIRLAAKLTQVQLAGRLNTTQVFISKYERGERNLDFIEVLQICSTCGYDPMKLIKKMKVDHK
jgi:DNA-binding transcriptional regulator YiaG